MQLFYDRFLSEDIMSVEERQVLFPNLIEILNLHRELNQALIDMKKRDGHVVKEIGDILLNRVSQINGFVFVVVESSWRVIEREQRKNKEIK